MTLKIVLWVMRLLFIAVRAPLALFDTARNWFTTKGQK